MKKIILYIIHGLILASLCYSSALLALTLKSVKVQFKGEQIIWRLTFDKTVPSFYALMLAQPYRLQIDLMDHVKLIASIEKEQAQSKNWQWHIIPAGLRLIIPQTQFYQLTTQYNAHELQLILQPQKSVTHSSPTISTITPAQAMIKPTDWCRLFEEIPHESISLQLHQIPLNQVLKILAEQSQLPIEIASTITQPINLIIDNEILATVFRQLVVEHGLAVQCLPNGWRIIKRKHKQSQEKGSLPSLEDSSLKLRLFALHYSNGEQIKALLQQQLLSPQGSVIVDQRTNHLLVKDDAAHLKQIEQALALIDVPLQQIQIEAHIVIARESLTKALGVRWGNVSAGALADQTALQKRFAIDDKGLFFGLGYELSDWSGGQASWLIGHISRHIQIGLELEALESEGLSHTLSRPKIVTLDRQPALISQGQEIPYQESGAYGSTSTSFRNALLALEVTPFLTPKGQVLLNVKVQNDSVASTRFNGLPAIDTSRLNSQVLLKDGETVVLGGILSEMQLQSITRIPGLSALPILGGLFRHRQNRQERVELLIFITPTILS